MFLFCSTLLVDLQLTQLLRNFTVAHMGGSKSTCIWKRTKLSGTCKKTRKKWVVRNLLLHINNFCYKLTIMLSSYSLASVNSSRVLVHYQSSVMCMQKYMVYHCFRLWYVMLCLWIFFRNSETKEARPRKSWCGI